MSTEKTQLTIKPVTPREWKDLESLFANPGDCRYCWCMWWRITRKQFDQNGSKGNRAAMKSIVESGEIPGLLGYRDSEPVAWCSVAPRESFPVLDRSPVLKRIDDKPVWSIACFYILPALRGQGLMTTLIQAAVNYAAEQGAESIEAYPIVPEQSKDPEASAFTGMLSTFLAFGFVEVARRSKLRVMTRYYL